MGSFFAKTIVNLNVNLALIARTEADLNILKSELIQVNPNSKISIHATDLSDPDQTKMTFDDIKLIHGHAIKAVICFAGSWVKSKELNALEMNDFLEGLHLNFFTTFNTIKETIRMSEPDLKGLSIITIGGTSSVWMNPEAPIMSVAKGAVGHYARILAKQLLHKEVHVAHIIIDGPVFNDRGQILNPDLQEEDFIKPESIVSEICHVINQTKDAWTFEWDIRSYTRKTKIL